MTLFLNILQSVLPVIVMILLGYVCNKKQIFDDKGLAGLKAIIGNVCLPVVLFNAFYTATYSLTVIPVFIIVYIGFGLAILAGFLVRKWMAPYSRFVPFLVTSAEVGMLGYALFSLIVGPDHLANLAMLDLGQTVFSYTVFITVLRVAEGHKMSGKEVVLNMVTNKACIGMSLGIILGATGVRGLIEQTAVAPIINDLISFITAPTSGVILLVVGYELSLQPGILKPVLKTVFARFVIMASLFGIVSFTVFHIIPFDKNMLLAMLIIYSLPAPFIIPIYANVGDDGEYVSTTLSVETLLTVALFVGIVAYSMI
ncbi:MAG: AEC family transporter [Lachnospiraceae bacterium]|nr:AEC family transporter [Lachnospiraceae bacterium]